MSEVVAVAVNSSPSVPSEPSARNRPQTATGREGAREGGREGGSEGARERGSKGTREQGSKGVTLHRKSSM